MYAEVLKDLETALSRRDPLLAERLQPALSVAKIRKALESARVNGSVEPIVELYSWKNGTLIDRELASAADGFFPGAWFQFRELKRAVLDFETYKEAAEDRPQETRLAQLVDRYFPFLWNGAVQHIAIDIEPSSNNRVVLIDTDSQQPLLELCSGFAEFIQDVLSANRENTPLRCLQKHV